MNERRLRLGAVGLGRAFSLMLPTFLKHPRVEMVAGADPRREARERFSRDFDARAFASIEDLCADARVEAVYIATPHELHAAHACLAAARGKHILVEKPMALTLSEGAAMIAAASAARVQLVVGHSHGFDAPIRRTRELVASGAFGALRMIHAVNYTDWLYRPRRPEELGTEGGGVLFNQAPHQVEMVRLIGGGRVASVRAAAGAWDRNRPVFGAYSALLTFAGGAFATLSYSGYGHFDSDEFAGWIGEAGVAKDPARYGQARKSLGRITHDEVALKRSRSYGSASYDGVLAADVRRHPHFGLLIASCDRADLRPGPEGVMIYGDEDARLDALPPPEIPRAEVIDELIAAVFDGRAPLHGGAWSLATMEVCIAMLQSARDHKEVLLKQQTELPNG